MKTLYLLRHAKSAWDTAGQPDHDRPLNDRGRKACIRLAEYIRRQHVLPAMVLCSSAARTQETWDRICDQLDRDFPTRIEEDLYLADPKVILTLIRRINPDVPSALVVGHNPGIGELMRQLVGEGRPKLVMELGDKVPTGALATLELPIESWTQVKSGRGVLKDYVTPRLLGE